MAKPISKLNPDWIKQTRAHFLEFLKITKFPHPVRNGQRGSAFAYPEWLIMFIAVLAVKCKVKTYTGIHRLALQYWPLLTAYPALHKLKPISESHESQLRERLKKSATHLEDLQVSFFKYFLQKSQKSSIKKVSADKMIKMMVKPKVPSGTSSKNLKASCQLA